MPSGHECPRRQPLLKKMFFGDSAPNNPEGLCHRTPGLWAFA